MGSIHWHSVLVELDKGAFTQSVFIAIANFKSKWKVKKIPINTHMCPLQTYE